MVRVVLAVLRLQLAHIRAAAVAVARGLLRLALRALLVRAQLRAVLAVIVALGALEALGELQPLQQLRGPQAAVAAVHITIARVILPVWVVRVARETSGLLRWVGLLARAGDWAAAADKILLHQAGAYTAAAVQVRTRVRAVLAHKVLLYLPTQSQRETNL